VNTPTDTCSCGQVLTAECDMARVGWVVYHGDRSEFIPMERILLYWGPFALRDISYRLLFHPELGLWRLKA